MASTTIADPFFATVGRYAGLVPQTAGAGAGLSAASLRTSHAGQKFTNLTAAGGAALDSGILDSRSLENLTIVAVNGSAVTARTVTITFYEENGATVLHTITRSLAVSVTEKYVIGPAREAAGLVETVTIAAPLDLAPFMRIEVAAAGADSVTVRAWGH